VVRVTGNPEIVLRSIKERSANSNPEWWWSQTTPFCGVEPGMGAKSASSYIVLALRVLGARLAATGDSVVSFAGKSPRKSRHPMASAPPRTSIIRLVLASTGTMLGFGVAIASA